MPMAATRWLDDEEQQAWRALLEATQLLWDRLERELDDFEDDGHEGLSLPEYEILVRLSEAPERRLRMSQLAEGVVHSRSRLTHTVGRMQMRGLVVREVCPNDGRGVLCVLTDAGVDLLVAAAPTHVTGVRTHLFDRLTPQEVQALRSGLSKVRSHLRGE